MRMTAAPCCKLLELCLPETFESDVMIFGNVLEEYRADVAAGRVG